MEQYYYEQEHPLDDLPVCCWNINSQTVNELIYYNFHKEVELIYVQQGTLSLFIDEKSLIIHENEIGIINTNRMHHGHSVDDSACIIRVYLFDLQQLISISPRDHNELLEAIVNDQLWFPSKISEYSNSDLHSHLLPILEQIFSYWQERPACCELKLKALLFELLFSFCSRKCLLREREWGSLRSNERREKILQLLTFFEVHYSEKLTVLQMAQVIYMGKETFYKFISSMTGSSPIAFLNQFRLKKAAELLSYTNQSVTEICFQVGFCNVSYFIRAFYAKYGKTPSKYRKEQNL